ncbi:hypothetical protein Tco_0578624 [Tanacetum coccineum]
MACFTIESVPPKVLAAGMYAIDIEPIPSNHRNNREVHQSYLKYLNESVETLREIVEEAKLEKPLDNVFEYAYLNKQVTDMKTCETSNNNTQKHVKQHIVKKTNVLVIPSTGVAKSFEAGGSKPRINTKNNRSLPSNSEDKKKVEDYPRNNTSKLKPKNRVDFSISYKRTAINLNSNSVCKTCNKCLISFNHDECVVKYLKSVNTLHVNMIRKPKSVKQVWKAKPVKQTWKATGKLFATIGYQWKPTRRKFTLGDQCPLTRST